MSHWDFNHNEGFTGDAWVATKEIRAKNYEEAINIFRDQLIPIVEKCLFVSQCFFSIYNESFIIFRKNNNQDRIAFIYFITKREPVHLGFDLTQIEDLKKLDNFNKPEVFGYIQESTNSSSYYVRLAMFG